MEYQPVTDHGNECALIMRVLHHSHCRDVVFDEVTEDYFSHQAARDCFTALQRVWTTDGEDIDSPRVQDGAMQSQSFQTVQTQAEASTWMEALQAVRQSHQRRQVQRAACLAYERAVDPMATSADLAEVANELTNSTEACNDDTDPTIEEIVQDHINRMGRLSRGDLVHPTTGLAGLDKYLTLEPGSLHVVAARPRVGKTALMLCCALAQAILGIPVGIVCVEMTAGELFDRLVSLLSGLPHEHFRNGLKGLTPAQLKQYSESVEKIRALPISFACGRSFKLGQIRTRVRQWKAKKGLDVLWVDYIQNLHHAHAKSFRESIIDTVSRLKAIGQEFGVPVLPLAQLSREAENNIPRLEHLKESGAIEEWAHSVTLLDRPDINEPGATDRGYGVTTQGKLIGTVAKNRNGETGQASFDFVGERMQITDISEGEQMDRESGPWGQA